VWGLKRYLARPEDQWMRREAPKLRIVDDALWTAAHRRLEESRASYLWSTSGKLNGRAPAVKAIDSEYLLTGFAQCAICGGSLMVDACLGEMSPRFAQLYATPTMSAVRPPFG
jgi:hypothetical protein